MHFQSCMEVCVTLTYLVLLLPHLRITMLRTFCLAAAATTSTAVLALIAFAPKISFANRCYMQTADRKRIDLSSLCNTSPPSYTIGQAPKAKNLKRQGQSLDLPAYCKEKYGSVAALTLKENNALGWRCMVEGKHKEIAYDEACSTQYGTEARPRMRDFDDIGSWQCAANAATSASDLDEKSDADVFIATSGS